MRSAPAKLALALLCAYASSGCGKIKRTKECGAVAAAVSAFLASAPKTSVTPTTAPELARDSRATAKRYTELDQRLSDLNVQSVELAPRVTHYRELARQAAMALEEVAVALEHGDNEIARRRRVEFDGVARAEPALVAEINNICRR